MLPVNDNSLILVSVAKFLPISAPPLHKVATAGGYPFCSNTFEIMLIVAMETKGVVGAGFHKIVSPQTLIKEKNNY